MISSILLCSLAMIHGQTPAVQGQPPSGAALISKMLARYANANSLVGKIQMVQRAQNQSVELDTDIAYEWPSKLYVRQSLGGAEPRNWLVTSDGTSFSYDYPNDRRWATERAEPGRLWEAVAPTKEYSENFRQIFHAAVRSLGDVSIPELLAIGGADEFLEIKNEVATIEFMGEDKIGGETVEVVQGLWRAEPRAQPSAHYKMYITPDGVLKRYVQDQLVSVDLTIPMSNAKNAPIMRNDSSAKMQPQQVVTTWDVDLSPNAKPDERLFTVVR